MADEAVIPRSVRALLHDFQRGVQGVLDEAPVGIYMLGSVAFPGFEPGGDVDFFVVSRRSPAQAHLKALRRMEQDLVRRHPLADHLDGFYISMAAARSHRAPKGLAGVRDNAWPLHRAHLRSGAYIRLLGPPAKRIFAPVSWREIDRALRGEHAFAREQAQRYPYWTVLQLCRLMQSYETGNVVISKLQAARWALRYLPEEWHPSIDAALRVYRGRQKREDIRSLKSGIRAFMSFASRTIDAARRRSSPNPRWL